MKQEQIKHSIFCQLVIQFQIIGVWSSFQNRKLTFTEIFQEQSSTKVNCTSGNGGIVTAYKLDSNSKHKWIP
jgi:hypothetical protein